MKFKSEKIISSTLITSAVCPVFLEAQTWGSTVNAVNTLDTQVLSGSKLRALSSNSKGSSAFYIVAGTFLVLLGLGVLFYFLKSKKSATKEGTLKEKQSVDEVSNRKLVGSEEGGVIKVEDNLEEEQSISKGSDVGKKEQLILDLNEKKECLKSSQTMSFFMRRRLDGYRMQKEALDKEGKTNEEVDRCLERFSNALLDVEEKIKKIKNNIKSLEKQLKELGGEGEQLGQFANAD